MGDSDKAKKFCALCCAGFWALFFIIFLAISMKTVSQGEYAFVFSHYQQDILGEPITEPGVKWVGPLNSLIRYPSVYQMVYFDQFDNYKPVKSEVVKSRVHSRTRDGLYVYVKVSFQWELKPENLKGIYRVLGGAEDLLDGERIKDKPLFTENMVRLARGSLTNVCSWYTAQQFFANQTLVEMRMQEELARAFNQPSKGLIIGVTGLQLRSVDLPDKYENSISETQKQQQDIQTAGAERATKDMQLSKEYMEAVKQQEVLWANAEARVAAIREENQAWVEQYMLFQRKQADAYASILEVLASNSTDPYGALFALIRQKALKDHKTDKVVLSG